jgi:hypothetical protein
MLVGDAVASIVRAALTRSYGADRADRLCNTRIDAFIDGRTASTPPLKLALEPGVSRNTVPGRYNESGGFAGVHPLAA